MTFREEIDRPKEDSERDDDVFDGEKDVDQYAIWGGGDSEADEWESVGSNEKKDEDLLDAEETVEEEEIEKEEIRDKYIEEQGSREPDLPLKVADFFAVSDNYNRHGISRRYLYGAVVPVRRQRPMDGGTGTQHLAEQTRNQEWRKHDLAEPEAETEAKR